MNLLFLDTETGGLSPWKHSLLQVGAVAYSNGRIVNKIKINVKHDNYVVTEKAMEINKIDLDELTKIGLSSLQAVNVLNDFISKNFSENPIIVGHNPSIDKYMVRNQLYEANNLEMDDFISHRMIDTMSLIWGFHIAGLLPSEACSSSGAFSHFGIGRNNLHDALEDSLKTLALYEKLIEMYDLILR